MIFMRLKKPGEKAEGREEAIRKVMEIIEGIQEETGMSYVVICGATRIPLATFGR